MESCFLVSIWNKWRKNNPTLPLPIRIDDYLFHDWQHERKADVVNKVVGDFRGWNRSATKYEAAFKRLLKALNAVG